jgi:hypothetical protein
MMKKTGTGKIEGVVEDKQELKKIADRVKKRKRKEAKDGKRSE